MKKSKDGIFIKIGVFLLGVFINSFGIALITKANLGTSQISGISYVLSLKYENLDFGTATFLLNVVFWLVQILILRSRTDLKTRLQLPVSFLLGSFININMAILQGVNPERPIFQWISLLLGCLILGLGISIELAPNIVKIPGEGIVYTISQEWKVNFGKTKVIFDIVLVTLAIIISFVSFGSLKGVGWGTLVSALLVGKVVNIFDKSLDPLYKKILK